MITMEYINLKLQLDGTEIIYGSRTIRGGLIALGIFLSSMNGVLILVVRQIIILVDRHLGLVQKL